MSFTETRYPNLVGPSSPTNAWQGFSGNEFPASSTQSVEDEVVLEWLAARGFAVVDIHEERSHDADPPGAAIHIAALEGSVRLMRWLAEHGADVCQRTTTTGAGRWR